MSDTAHESHTVTDGEADVESADTLFQRFLTDEAQHGDSVGLLLWHDLAHRGQAGATFRGKDVVVT